MKSVLAGYLTRLNQACLINARPARCLKIDSILMEMRRDRRIPHLTLCGFLQDQSRIIKENQE